MAMGDVVPLRDRPRVSLGEIWACTWMLALHMKLAKGGVHFQYRCKEHPRLRCIKARADRKSPNTMVFFCDEEEFPTLEAALAKLNGDPIPPPPEAKMPEQPAPKKVSIGSQINEVDYELDQRRKVYPRIAMKEPGRKSELEYHVERMTAVRATLVWVSENEAAIREWAAEQKRKKDTPAEAGATQEAQAQ